MKLKLPSLPPLPTCSHADALLDTADHLEDRADFYHREGRHVALVFDVATLAALLYGALRLMVMAARGCHNCPPYAAEFLQIVEHEDNGSAALAGADDPMPKQTTAAEITSFGYGHAAPPAADIVVDARRRFRNPHADPRMRELTGLEEIVRSQVLATPGVAAVIRRTAQLAAELTTTTTTGPVTVAVGCVGGRHRSVAMAAAIATELTDAGLPVALVHRDVDRPVIQR
ncbi:RNase adapter RapZ [Nonomuraea sp. NPDC026600]|uniref:RapZ C-terminal domain-containing protein n=1 Tax=Nonomuraea sp. NPDC026600 TaxID=3155363 RepID=UPI0033ED46EF